MRVVVGSPIESLMKLDDISQLIGIMNFVFLNKELEFERTSASPLMALVP